MEIQYPNSYVAFDFETTGLDPKNDKIVEIGALKVINGKITEAYHAILNHDIEIPEEASNIHGITTARAKAEGIDPKEATRGLLDFFFIDGEIAPTLTHNGYKFDIPFLFNALTIEQLGSFQKPISKGCIDTAVIYKARAVPVPRLWRESFTEWAARVMDTRAFGVKFNVTHCCKELGISIEGKTLHNALTDIQLTHDIYQKLCHSSNSINSD